MTAVLVACSGVALAQDTTEERRAAEAARLKAEKELLDAQKELLETKAAIATSRATIAAQEAAALKAAFPTDKITPLAGSLTAKEFTFPLQMLSYSAAEQMADKIASDIISRISTQSPNGKRPRIVIRPASDALASQEAMYDELVTRIGRIKEDLKAYKKEFEDLTNSLAQLPAPAAAAAEFVRAAGSPPLPDFVDATKTAPDGTQKSFVATAAAVGAAVVVATSTIQSVAQLVALFRTDTDLQGAAVSLDPDVLATLFAKALQRSSIRPEIIFPTLLPQKNSPVLFAISELFDARSIVMPAVPTLDAYVVGLAARQKEIEDEIKKRVPVESPPSETSSKLLDRAMTLAKAAHQVTVGKIGVLKQRIAASDLLVSAMDKALQTVDEKTGSNALASIMKSEALILALRVPGTYSLLLKPLNGGGATRTDKNLFTGTKLRHLGGALFVATLTDDRGSMLYTHAAKGFHGYSELKGTGGVLQQDLETSTPTRAVRKTAR